MLAVVEELVRGKWVLLMSWPQLFTVALWGRGNSAEITGAGGPTALRYTFRSSSYTSPTYFNDTCLTNINFILSFHN